MDDAKKINEVMVSLFNIVLKIEEKAIKESTIHDLSITEMHILDVIGIGNGRTMSEVAQRLQINLSTLTTAINKLVKKGYVERFRIPSDRRIVKIKLTKEGIDAVKEHEAFHDELIRKALGKVSDEEIKSLIVSLDNIDTFMHMQMAKPIRDERDYSLGIIDFQNLHIKKALFQGGMGVGISLGGLAGAVAKEGGMGIISGSSIGFDEEDFETDPQKANRRALKKEIKKALAIADTEKNRGMIGVNIPYNTEDYREYVKTAVSEGAGALITGAGLPMTLPGICEREGYDKIALIPVISSLRAARVIMKNWQKKHKKRPDAFIFESAMAGGQLGFKESELIRARELYYKTITDIKTEIEDIPLIVAGGISSREDARNAYVYGADGIQLGTRFVTTKECDAKESYKQAYINCKEEDIIIIMNPQGAPCRALANKFTKNLQGTDYDITEALVKAAKGDVKNGLVFCGSKAYKAKKIDAVEDIFKEFI